MSHPHYSLSAVFKAVNGILTSLSEGNEIKVIFAGTPCTDGRTIYLGEPPADTGEALDAYLSHGTHEIHHVLFSSFEEIASLGPLHPLVNALEDVRIDSIGYGRYPGAYLWRNDHFTKLAREGKLPTVTTHGAPVALLCLTCYWVMTELMLGYDCAKAYAEEAETAFVERFGRALYDKVYRLSEQAVRGPDTAGVIRAARKIAQLFADLFPQEPQGTQNQSPEKTGAEEAEDGHSVSSSGAAQSVSYKTNKGDGQGNEDCPEETFDVHRIVEESFKESREKARTSGLVGGNEIWPAVRSDLSPRNDPEYLAEAEALRSQTGRRFQRYLQANRPEPGYWSRSGRDLDRSKLVRFFTGDFRIFRHESDVKRHSAAVCILLDRSGSMSREDMRTASLCAQALAGAVDSIVGCRSAAYAFPGVERQTLLEVKRFEERTADTIERFCALRPFGYTPIRQSLNSAAVQLINRKESRKIIFMITDGLSDTEESLEGLEVKFAACGIEIVCLGIGDVNTQIFKIQRNIRHVSEMNEAVSKLLERSFSRQRL